jgi:pilus assembly protein CpaB
MKLHLNRSWLMLGVALLVGALAALGMHRYLRERMLAIEEQARAQKMVTVLVAKDNLSKGATLNADVVAVREIPADWAHAQAITPAQIDQLEQQKLAYPAARGEMLLWPQLQAQSGPTFASRLGTGLRAITVPVDDINSLSGMLEPGDRIDLVAAIRQGATTTMLTLLQDVLILATGAHAAGDGEDKAGRRSYTTITLEATALQAQQVLAAREVGKLAALLRAPADHKVNVASAQEALHLLGLVPSVETGQRHSVPVLYGNDLRHKGLGGKSGQEVLP